MRKIWLIAILLIGLACFVSAPPSAQATDYWACASADAGAANEWDTVSAACTGTKLTWASRVAATLHANSFTVALTSATTGDPGANGAMTLSNDNSAGSTAGGGFTCDTTAGPATMTLSGITAGSTTTPALAISGSKSGTANCGIAGTATLQGGGGAGGNAVTDTHTVGALSHTCTLTKGGTNASALGYSFASASGSVALTCNVWAGTAGAGFNNSGTGGTASITGQCIGSDTSNGAAGCICGVGSSASIITLKGSAVSGVKTSAIQGKVYFDATGAATNAFYLPISASYAATDIVDASGNVKSPPTLTNAMEFPLAFATTGIGNVAKVVSGTVYGSLTGTASTGSNSGSAH